MWIDSRVTNDVCNGTVEIFLNEYDLKARKNYLEMATFRDFLSLRQ
jgi:hypothetical protein